MSTAHVVACAGCRGLFSLPNRPRPGHWFCDRCDKRQRGKFRLHVGGTVRLVDDASPALYVVRVIDGDEVTLRRQGFPRTHPLGREFTRRRGDIDPVRST